MHQKHLLSSFHLRSVPQCQRVEKVQKVSPREIILCGIYVGIWPVSSCLWFFHWLMLRLIHHIGDHYYVWELWNRVNRHFQYAVYIQLIQMILASRMLLTRTTDLSNILCSRLKIDRWWTCWSSPCTNRLVASPNIRWSIRRNSKHTSRFSMCTSGKKMILSIPISRRVWRKTYTKTTYSCYESLNFFRCKTCADHLNQLHVNPFSKGVQKCSQCERRPSGQNNIPSVWWSDLQ